MNKPAPTRQRRLAAFLCADVAGYTRLMGADERGILRMQVCCKPEIPEPISLTINCSDPEIRPQSHDYVQRDMATAVRCCFNSDLVQMFAACSA